MRQQTVAQLGELDAVGRVRARALAEAIIGVERQPGLFEEPEPAQPVTVDLRGFRLERGRRFGDVWLGLRLWQALGLDTLLAELLPAGGEDVPWAQMAAVLVLARFREPSSELHIAEDWFRRTALGDLLGIADDKVNDDRLYRALDRVLPQKLFLEVHLQQRLGRLFGLEYDLLLYDITSTYFEGQGQSASSTRPLARLPPRLQAGLDRPGRQSRRLPIGLRGVCRQSPRQHNPAGDGAADGDPVRSAGTHLGFGTPSPQGVCPGRASGGVGSVA
ncbi:MAG TPA: hypothetical protein VH682_23775 [Gemmataceae bacterium]